MKKLLTSACLALSFLTGPAVCAAEAKPSAAPAAAAVSFAGEFAGDWLGENGTGGTLKLTFTSGKAAAWTMEAMFTFEGAAVPTTTKTVEIDGGKLTTVFAWEVQGTAASSKLVGELKGDQLEGTYESTTTEGAAKGKWKVARKPAGS
jgi:hypothetical protein